MTPGSSPGAQSICFVNPMRRKDGRAGQARAALNRYYPSRRAVAAVALGIPLSLLAGLAAPGLWAAGLAWSVLAMMLVLADIAGGDEIITRRFGDRLQQGRGVDALAGRVRARVHVRDHADRGCVVDRLGQRADDVAGEVEDHGGVREEEGLIHSAGPSIGFGQRSG